MELGEKLLEQSCTRHNNFACSIKFAPTFQSRSIPMGWGKNTDSTHGCQDNAHYLLNQTKFKNYPQIIVEPNFLCLYFNFYTEYKLHLNDYVLVYLSLTTSDHIYNEHYCG